MASSEFKKKYPIESWIVNPDMLKIGDHIVYEEFNSEIKATYVGEFSKSKIKIKTGGGLIQIINIFDTIVFKLGTKVQNNITCTCGAKHTSNPTFHLYYCDLS